LSDHRKLRRIAFAGRIAFADPLDFTIRARCRMRQNPYNLAVFVKTCIPLFS
jgi:hypothetical protein